jgi:hypothetical protein
MVDADVDTRLMLDNIFDARDEGAECGGREEAGDIRESNDGTDIEERAANEVMGAFTTADVLHEECTQINDNVEGLEEIAADAPTERLEEFDDFNHNILEEAMQRLYPGSKCSKLAATIVLLNSCSVHGLYNSVRDTEYRLEI